MKEIIVSASELAHFLGVNYKAIQRLTITAKNKDGVLTKVKYGKYNLQQAVNDFYDHRLNQEKKKNQEIEVDIADSRRIKEEYDAKLTKMKYEKEIGMLIESSEAQRKIEKIIINAKTKLLALPVALTPKLLKQSSKLKIKNILENGITKSLQELTQVKI